MRGREAIAVAAGDVGMKGGFVAEVKIDPVILAGKNRRALKMRVAGVEEIVAFDTAAEEAAGGGAGGRNIDCDTKENSDQSNDEDLHRRFQKTIAPATTFSILPVAV